MRIIVDLMGGDKGPLTVYQGIKNFYDEKKQENGNNLHFILVGNKEELKDVSKEIENNSDFEFIHCDNYITMNDKPTKRDEETSIAICARLLKEEKGDALFSVGHTGAIMNQAVMKFGRIKNIIRPCIAARMPHAKGNFVLVDAGANVDCTPEQVYQFAIMGSLYAKEGFNIENPRVALLNIGKEEKKGNKLTHQVYQMLKNQPKLNFIGNIEGEDIYKGEADVIVCEGFGGNVFLKTSEGIAKFIMKYFYQTLVETVQDKELIQKIFAKVQKTFDPSEYGGGAFIGLNKICIKGHGGSNIKSVKNSMDIAFSLHENEINRKLEEFVKDQN
jgi:glycerol-3-phosphate acyltransferase PlsX